MINKVVSRRSFLKLSATSATSIALFPSIVLAAYPDQPRVLAMNNLHTGEALESCYFDGKSYVNQELARLDNLCRDFRRNEVHPMDKILFDQLSQIQNLIGTKNEIQIISGYRSPATNEALRAKSSGGVAKKSFHMLGKAIDFRIEGIKLSQVREAALSMKAGGVGYYPKSQFVHIDTGPVRSW